MELFITAGNVYGQDLISLASSLQFSSEKSSIAEKTIEKLARAARLYAQDQEEPFDYPLLGLYERRWSVGRSGIQYRCGSGDFC